ncbi:hypothetical protein V8Z81_27225 (plasmid) [Priestia megaterium]|uniref:hypothetical protein n=1 Tax=Priestia megaterium TaxID=1404 RepID=UPI0030CFB184
MNSEVRRACLEFAKWLRKEFAFPIRVLVYLKKDDQIKNKFTKELVSATFFAPYDKQEEPYIRIATGDYMELLHELGKDDALASILNSIAHELGHYYQWIDDEELEEESAEDTADYIMGLYSDTRDHP